MERIRTHLFIGGTKDGERIVTPDDYSYLTVPVETKIERFIWDKPTEANPIDEALPDYSCEHYRLEILACKDKRFEVWVKQGLTTIEALERLINGYHPKEAK